MTRTRTQQRRFEGLIPAIGWLRRYRGKDLPGDLTAGLVVAVMLIPQGMAYAMLAGLPPVVGLYASTVPLLAYALLGSSRQLAVGPVAIVSLLTLSGVSQLASPGSPEFVALTGLLALMVGVIQGLLGLLRAGFVVNFLSHAVISGFTSAAALVIGFSQLKHLLGISFEQREFLPLVAEATSRLGETHLATLLIGAGSIAVLLAFRRFARRFPAPLLVVALATVAVALFGLDAYGVKIVGAVPAGVPFPSLPLFSFEAVRSLLPVALTISFVGFMESVAVAKSIATREGYEIHANHELRGLGFANIAAALFSGYPVTGGFSRSAVNYQAGARTPLASVITALLITLTLLLFTPLFHDLPRAVLAAIVMVAVFGLINLAEPRLLFRTKPIDGWTLVLTFVATLAFGIELGILIGVAFSLLVFIWRSAYPHTAELGYLAGEEVFRNVERYPQAERFEGTVIVRPDASLYFANSSFLVNWLDERIAARRDVRRLVLDFSGVNDVDAVALESLAHYFEDLESRGVEIHIANMKGPVRDLARRAGWERAFGERIAHLSLAHALAVPGFDPAGAGTRKPG